MVQLGKGNITADFTAGGEIGSIGVVRGNITSDITGSDGIGSVVATFGNVSGSIYSGGKIGEIVEDLNAAKGDIDISLKLVKGDTSYISALETTFALSDTSSTAHPYVYIRTNDEFTGIGTIQVKGSTSTTSFAITMDGGLFELDKFLVTGNFGSLTDAAGGGADATMNIVEIGGAVAGSLGVDGGIGTLTVKGNATNISAASIGTASIKGVVTGTVRAGVIGTISVSGLGEDGTIVTGVVSGSTFTYTVGGATDTVSVVGANWRVTVDDGNVIDADLTKILASKLTFTTTSSVDDLNADLSDRDLSLIIGGDILGVIAIHSGDLSVGANDLRGEIEVTAGVIESIDLKGDIKAGADIRGTVLDFSLGGSIDPSLAEMYHLNTKVDDDPITSGDQNLYPDHITLDNGQVISVVGSAASLDAYVNVAFDRFALDTTIQGSGSLNFSSTGSLLDNIAVANGSKVTVKSVFVDGDMGGFINTNV
ncbi:MAG: hypothetical protein MUO70_01125, partial [Euryarchaeota archaeon]|nr:hypothetical protein [Euryarchaeota archaeon]